MAGEADRVVFDCVVYAQAIINPDGPASKCLELAREGALSLCISEYLLTEIRELPVKLAPRLKITAQKVEVFIIDLVTFSRLISGVQEVFVLERDRDDSHYIKLALAASAKLITTRDRDLLDLMDQSLLDGQAFRRLFPDLLILTPPELLALMRRDSA